MQNRDRHYARRFDDDRPNSPKNKKKLPRRERIAKLTASRFSSAIIEKRAEHSERNRINEKKRSSCRNRGETPAARCSFRAAEQKTRQKGHGHIVYLKNWKRRRKKKQQQKNRSDLARRQGDRRAKPHQHIRKEFRSNITNDSDMLHGHQHVYATIHTHTI